MNKTGIIWDELFTRHSMGLGHPESPSRLLSIKQVLDGDGVGKKVLSVKPRPASIEEMAFVHAKKYISYIESTKDQENTILDPDTSANAFTWTAACLAAGAGIILAEQVVAGRLNNAFALVRPPGHHAEQNQAMGFCIFNNIAIAAQYALKKLNIERIFIIDYDTHHGNGTQDAFYENPNVFYFSVHRAHFYPGTGTAEETGKGSGKGFNLNIPLESGATDDVYKKVFDKHLIPAIEEFKPQLILVSAGFDAHVRDPLGGMKATTKGFAWMAETIMQLAQTTCSGKAVFFLEGGYDLKALRDSVEVTLEAMVSTD
ncbi:MAG: histone deacetylase [Pseudomonadota bacterium]